MFFVINLLIANCFVERKVMRKILAISAATSALLVGSVLPAHAVAWDGNDIIVGDESSGTYTQWGPYSEPALGHSYRYVEGTQFDNVICEGSSFEIDGNYFELPDSTGPSSSDWDLITDANGDQVLTLDGQFTTDSSVLDATAEVRFYAEGDLMRMTYVLTNNTGAAITFTPVWIDGSSIDSYGSGSTSDGDQVWEVSDWWLTAYNSSYPSVVATWLFGAPDLLSIETVADSNVLIGGDRTDFTMSDVTIQPGASTQFVFFYSMRVYNLGGGAAAAAAAADDALISEYASGHLAGRLLRGLDETVPGANVHLGAALAETGVDASGIAIGGAMLAAAGIAFVATRRRKASN
jgi:LPXTG-motif cell wall-anchored protein